MYEQRFRPGTATGQESFTVGEFQPEDAEGIVRLFRSVYGEHYPIRLFYDRDESLRSIRNDRNEDTAMGSGMPTRRERGRHLSVDRRALPVLLVRGVCPPDTILRAFRRQMRSRRVSCRSSLPRSRPADPILRNGPGAAIAGTDRPPATAHLTVWPAPG